MAVLTILLGGVILLFLWLLRHLTKNRGHLETLGIPLDKPHGLLGSGPFDYHNHVHHRVIQEKFRKFGSKTFGRYDGVYPVVVSIDPEVVKSVLVKNFDSFTDVFAEVDVKHTTLDVSCGETWRVLRKSLSPTFTSGKLKGMMEPMGDVAEDFIKHVDKKVEEGSEVEVKQIFHELALNTICRCAFGLRVNAHENPDEPLAKHGAAIFQEFRCTGWGVTLFFHLINYFPVILKTISVYAQDFDRVWDITKSLMKQRTDANVQMKDYLDRLIELQKKREASPDSDEMKHLKEEMIVSQGVIFFIAGYETTANALSTTCYYLAKYPEIQEKVFSEVQSVVGAHGGRLDYETIGEMHYLEATLNEDLRIAGPVTLHQRICNKDTEVVPGLFIKKGMRVDLPIFASHHCPDFFPQPDEFRPERFLKENAEDIVPYTFRPFGGGPRVCIGQRFALAEMKLALAKLILKYRIVESENTRLPHNKGDLFFVSYPEMKVKLEPRN